MTQSRTATPAAEESEDDVVPETEETETGEPNGEPEDQPTAEAGSESPEAPPATAEGDTAEPRDGGAEGGEQPDSGAPEAQPAAEEPDEHVEATPFSFRFHGRQIDVPDAVRTPFGIVMSEEAWKRTILPRMGDPEAGAQRESQLRTKIRELETAQSEKLLRAQALTDEIDALLEDPNRLAEFLQDFERNKKVLETQVENRILKAQHERPATPTADSLDDEGQIRSLAEQLPSWLDTGIEALQKEPEIKALGLTSQELFDVFYPLRGQLFDWDEGLNQYVVRLDVMRSHLRPFAGRLKAAAAGASAQVAAAKHNARALGQPGKAPPPVAGAKGSPVAAPAKKKYASRQEWEADLLHEALTED